MKYYEFPGNLTADVDSQKMSIYKNGVEVAKYSIGDLAIFDKSPSKTWISEIKNFSEVSEMVTVKNSGSFGYHLTATVQLSDFVKWNAEYDGSLDKPEYVDCTKSGWYTV